MKKTKYTTKWVNALRSGKYKQTIGVLRMTKKDANYMEATPGYCCLGVACSLLIKETKKGISNFSSCGSWYSVGLNDKTKKLFGLTNKETDRLIAMNDTYKLSFKEIADYIEKKAK